MNSIQQATANLSNLPIKMIMARLKIPTPPVLEGAGMVLRFPEVIAVTGVKRVLIIAGPNVSASGMVDPFVKALKQNGIDAVLYDNTMPNPTIQNVYDAVKTYNVHQCDAVVGFGGGSSIDCAKIVAAKATNSIPVEQMDGAFKLRSRTAPFFAVPTTSGSGSECSIASVIVNPETKTKNLIADTRLIPLAVCLDPKLAASMPPSVTAATGMDALTHAIEAYVGDMDTSFVRDKALCAGSEIFAHLENAYIDGDNLDERMAMMHAAFFAGEAFTRGFVGYVHAFAHAIGARYNLSHGMLNAMLLPHVLRFYLKSKKATAKMSEFAYNAGLGELTEDDKTLAQALIARIEDMNDSMDIPKTTDAIIPEDVPHLVDHALNEARLYPVPIVMTTGDGIQLIASITAR